MKKGIVLAFLLLINFPMFVHAEDEYGITTEKSVYQRDTGKSYFDLRLKPGQKTKIAIYINNFSNEEGKFHISANTATTSDGLTINYSQTHPILDSTMKIPFSKIAKVLTPDVTIPAKKAKKVEIEISMPEEEFSGIVLGGIHTMQVIDSKNQETKSGFVNRISYVSGVCITENDKKVKPNLLLKKVIVNEKNGNVAIESKLQNPTNINLSPLTWRAVMTNLDNGKVVREQKQNSAMIAPNTSFSYWLKFENNSLKTGNYRMRITATLPDKRQWVLTKDFKVTVSDLKNANTHIANTFSMKPEESHDMKWLFALLGVLFAVVLGGFFILFAKRRKKKEEESEGET